jgi:branched-chain amino acid transport system ATP-binding protein
MAMLEVSNLEAAYGPVQALRGVSIKVERGNIVALLGANGAGKTTVLKVISGVVDPRSGGVRLDDLDIAGLEPDRIVGMGLSHVPEGREVFRVRTVHENLILGAYRRKDHKAIAEDIERMYEYFPILKERRTQRAGLLSGGQQQMLAISRALMARPRLLLLDEPSLGLSPLLVREIFSIVRRLREEGITILLVEQNAAMALEVADYGYIMEVGRIALEGDAASLRENPTVREFYLGMGQDDTAGAARASAKRKPLWR